MSHRVLAGRHAPRPVRRASFLNGLLEHDSHAGGKRLVFVERRALEARDDRVFFRGRSEETVIKHCVVCASPVQVWKGQHAPYLKVSCPECGDYGLTIPGLAKMKNAGPEARARIRAELGDARRRGYRIDICMDESGGLGTRRGRLRNWSEAR